MLNCLATQETCPIQIFWWCPIYQTDKGMGTSLNRSGCNIAIKWTAFEDISVSHHNLCSKVCLLCYYLYFQGENQNCEIHFFLYLLHCTKCQSTKVDTCTFSLLLVLVFTSNLWSQITNVAQNIANASFFSVSFALQHIPTQNNHIQKTLFSITTPKLIKHSLGPLSMWEFV